MNTENSLRGNLARALLEWRDAGGSIEDVTWAIRELAWQIAFELMHADDK